tara:strand:- start:312 stop:677 length:366 start_codon:yes stop_codon:yes gene_type:complete
MNDKINIKNLVAYAIIGINSWERQTKQKIEIDIEIESDLSQAMQSDDINDTVNYRTISKKIMEHVASSEYYLVEKLANKLIEICFNEDQNCISVKMTIRKPGAVRFSESVGVTITRKRNEK